MRESARSADDLTVRWRAPAQLGGAERGPEPEMSAMTAKLAVSYLFTAATSGQDLQELVPGLVEKPRVTTLGKRGEVGNSFAARRTSYTPHLLTTRRQIPGDRVNAQGVVLCPLGEVHARWHYSPELARTGPLLWWCYFCT